MSLPPTDDLRSKLRFDQANGKIWLAEARMLLMHSSTFGALRTELIETFGVEKAKGILMRIGFESGRADAMVARQLRPDVSDEEQFAVGPQLHTLEGIALVEQIKLEMDIKSGHYYGEYYWCGSIEDEVHLQSFGPGVEPSCWNQIGYACGYTSEFMGKPILFKEIECASCGDLRCRIIGKPAEEWEDSEELLAYLDADSFAETLLALNDEIQDLRASLRGNVSFERIIAKSEKTREVLDLLETAASCDVTVLLLGETGVGKDLFCQVISSMSNRDHDKFVTVNCAAIPRDLIESELFGVEKGAFTGAEKSRPGRFERADGGVLFLDEVGELSERAQAKLLRVVQTGEVERVGDTKMRKVDVRIIAATNADLSERVKDGSFRADLFYRLNVFPITIPPLRERLADLPELIQRFIRRYNTKYGRQVKDLSDLAMQSMKGYSWPGNIRELENVIERGVILTKGRLIDVPHLFPGIEDASDAEGFHVDDDGHVEADLSSTIWQQLSSSGLSLDEIEKNLLQTVLDEVNGNASEAARVLKMKDAQFRYRIKRHDIKSL